MLLENMEKDMVNHPKHYKECSIECIDAMRLTFGDKAVYNYCICNAFKYLWRHEYKNGQQDIQKGKWYIEYIYENFVSEAKDDKERLIILRDMLYNKLAN